MAQCGASNGQDRRKPERRCSLPPLWFFLVSRFNHSGTAFFEDCINKRHCEDWLIFDDVLHLVGIIRVSNLCDDFAHHVELFCF
jgi:hypothetical protein